MSLRFLARTAVEAGLFFTVFSAAHANIIFEGQTGNVDAVEIPPFASTQIQGVSSIPNSDSPVWGYSTSESNTASGADQYGHSGTATAGYSLNTLASFSGSSVQFQGQEVASTSAQSSTYGYSASAHAQSLYTTYFDLTSAYQYSLTVFSTSAAAFFFLSGNNEAGTLYDYTGSGPNGSTQTFEGTLARGLYYFEGLTTADAEGDGNGQSSLNSLHYTFNLTSVSTPAVTTTLQDVSGGVRYSYSFTSLSGTGDIFIPILDLSGLVDGSLPADASLITDPADVSGDWSGADNGIPSSESAFDDPAGLVEIPEDDNNSLSVSFLDSLGPVEGPILADGTLLDPPVPGLSPTSVPEPGALVLFIAGITGLWFCRRRLGRSVVANSLASTGSRSRTPTNGPR